jgi:hypothetical protein
MYSVQELAVKAKGNTISADEFISGCSKLIRDASYRWFSSIGIADGRDQEEKIHLCSIWCWEAIQKYNLDRGFQFTTFYYKHVSFMIKNLMRKSKNDNERANSYTNCFSYEFSLKHDEGTSSDDSAFVDYECTTEEGFDYIEMEMMLKDNGYDDITINIIKRKMDNPDTTSAEIGRELGYSRAYISLLWRKVQPFLIKELTPSL